MIVAHLDNVIGDLVGKCVTKLRPYILMPTVDAHSNVPARIVGRLGARKLGVLLLGGTLLRHSKISSILYPQYLISDAFYWF